MSLFALIAETARSMVGVPSYAAYRAHMAEHHPDAAPMDQVAFFRDRQQARYGGKGGGRCC
ncbi:YbdD/YjiX family protein [Sphingomonas mollis]|uniref:YbdD/YjiX family protein n=1 Tax=Sphingomonas mollis TaxID=2795726 RepID=A0ABS0XMX3_9SPHN|nr:YbdD/YjiX family protein [Sphingomonas sp. BT553]MBJ6121386.1 YbdD/YjiX family protein [Sphingomonas sp. BT553]